MSVALDLYRQAQELIKQKRFDDALPILDQSLALEQTAEALHDKGIIHYLRRESDQAVTLLQSAVKIKPDYAQAYANLAKIMLDKGNHIGAMEYTGHAMKADPDNLVYQNYFIHLLDGLDFKIFNPTLKTLVLQCLESEMADHDKLFRPWYSLLQCDPAFRLLHKLEKQKNYVEFKKTIGKLKSLEELYSPYFLLGLRRVLVSEMAFEKLMTHLRRYLLEVRSEETLPLAAALAEYCFRTEYIFSLTKDEVQASEELRQNVESGATSTPLQIALLGCYMPLYRLKNAAAIVAGTPQLDDLLTRQIREPFEELEYRRSITALTPIDDETSQEVRAQYEEFPYPRWRALSHAYAVQINFEQPIKDILVAGCGTGQEALQFAKAFPQAQVLAIDMSLSSLSYAMRKAKEYGIENITFRQADILRLGILDKKFDLITSSGVLHHLRDPLAGWNVLLGLLKPRGYMQIALYSELARRDIVAARKIIAENEYDNDLEGMRRFRDDCPLIMDKETLRGLLSFRDFFSASECRDLLFHVMEHRFTLPQIKSILPELGLEFLAFTLPGSLKAKYVQAHADDPALSNLDTMMAYEQSHPDTFKAMYVFWLRKLSH